MPSKTFCRGSTEAFKISDASHLVRSPSLYNGGDDVSSGGDVSSNGYMSSSGGSGSNITSSGDGRSDISSSGGISAASSNTLSQGNTLSPSATDKGSPSAEVIGAIEKKLLLSRVNGGGEEMGVQRKRKSTKMDSKEAEGGGRQRKMSSRKRRITQEEDEGQPEEICLSGVVDTAEDEGYWKGCWGNDWHSHLLVETEKQYFRTCINSVKTARKRKTIFPPESQVFEAFKRTPINRIKVVIVGQDPYHNPGQAMGLCFSVPRGEKLPPSLRNIFKEIGFKSNHGDLTSWADQGVFMLNASLTVEINKPASHQSFGWEQFTNRVIEILNQETEKLVFLLWGQCAQKKAACVDRTRHFVLEAGHPSPLSQKYFFGCDHFLKCNEILASMDKTPISWETPQLPD